MILFQEALMLNISLYQNRHLIKLAKMFVIVMCWEKKFLIFQEFFKTYVKCFKHGFDKENNITNNLEILVQKQNRFTIV